MPAWLTGYVTLGAGPLHDGFHGNEMNFEDQIAELERGAHEVLIALSWCASSSVACHCE